MIVTDQKNNLDDDTKKRSITIGLFLDGTLGNKYNTETRLEYNKKYGIKDEVNENKVKATKVDEVKVKVYDDNNEDESSYSNAYSNVAKLYEAYIEKDTENKYKFYVEGPGSIYFDDKKGEDRYSKDEDFEGNGLGKGVNGIRGKMYKVLRKAISKIDKNVEKVTFDVFGFSRGAAGARHLIYEIKRQKGLSIKMEESDFYKENPKVDYATIDRLEDKDKYKTADDSEIYRRGLFGYLLGRKGIKEKDLTIVVRFLGAFDTVASYSLKRWYSSVKGNPDFKKDIGKLGLDAGSASYKVHLTSDDEHRVNFSLTPVSGATAEHGFMGVHTDIGGGYVHNSSYSKIIAEGEEGVIKRRKEWLEKNCFFGTNNSRSKLIIDGDELKSAQKNINGKYDQILLEIMDGYIKKFIPKKTVLNNGTLKKYLEILPLNIHPTILAVQALVTNELIDGSRRWMLQTTPSGSFEKHLGNVLDITMIKYSNNQTLSDDDVLSYTRKRYLEYVFSEGAKLKYLDSSEIVKGAKLDTSTISNIKNVWKNKPNSTPKEISLLLAPLMELLMEQIVIRHLRIHCLHWSSFYDTSYTKAPHVPVPENGAANGTRFTISASGVPGTMKIS